MYSNKIVAILFAAVLGLSIANAALIEEVKVSAEDAKKFSPAPKIADIDGEKAFVSTLKGYKLYRLKKSIEIDPDKKYLVSVKLKQIDDKPSYTWIGFVPYDAKGRIIGLHHGQRNTKGSFTTLTENAAKGAKTITLKDASKWKKGKHFYVAFDAKEDMSDVPNFDIARIGKIENNTITLTKPLKKAYPAGTMVRQHCAGGTYVYTKYGKAPEKWTLWKGKPAQGAMLRKATHIRPMIMIRCNDKEAGTAFKDFTVEDISKK
jgi:hypothetical protein